MFSRESIRKSLPSIHRVVVAATNRPFYNQSRSSTSSSSSPSSASSLSSTGGFGSNEGDKTKFSDFNRFLRSVSSGIVILGTSLGLFYYSSLSQDSNAFRSFADYSNETTLETNKDVDNEGFQESRPEKKPIFLFKGIPCSVFSCVLFSRKG